MKQENENVSGRRPISISNKLLIAMLSVVFLQGILFVIITLAGGEPRLFRENSCSLMEDDVYSHSVNLSGVMNTASTDTIQYQEKLCQLIDSILSGHQAESGALNTDKDLQNEVIRQCYSELVMLMRRSKVSGTFLILGDERTISHGEEYSGIYLRDFDPDINLSDEDLILEIGPGELAAQNGLALDSKWSQNYDLKDNENGKFYFQALRSVDEFRDLDGSKLGYWSKPFNLRNDDMQIITFSLPLLNKEREVYGVMGVELSIDYLEKCFSLNNSISEGSDSYVIAVTNMGKNTVYTPLYTIGGSLPEPFREKFSFYDNDYNRNIYTLSDDRTFACAKNLNLYDRTSPYYRSGWTLVGLVDKDVLFKDSNSLIRAVALAFVVSMLVSIVVTVWNSNRLTNPLVKMIKIIRENNSQTKLVLEKTKIRELDELGSAVMKMDEDVRESASKLTTIVDLVHLPLGAVEFDTKSYWAFCTKQVLDMLELDTEQLYGNYIPRSKIEEFIKHHKLWHMLEKDEQIVVRLTGREDIKDRWLRFITQKNGNKTLIAVLDVTNEILEKQKLEYERNFDLLTQLLNHRAFQEKVREILRISRHKLGAMIMWDLDNLKYVNDNYGHDLGDQYIKRAGQILASLTIEGAIVGRISGDEFMAYLPQCISKAVVMQKIADLKKNLNDTLLYLPDGKSICVRASAGVAWYPCDGEDYDTLKKKADFAMYDTKRTYKGFYKEFDPSAYEREAVLLESKEELNRIIEEEAIRYAFQPIVDAHTGEIMGYEALMRPCSDQLKTPAEVMRVASAQSKLFEIERLTSKLTMAAYKRQKESFGECKMFINSIPNQFMVVRDEEELNSNKDTYRHVVLEIIESEQTDVECMELKRKWANKYGAGIALDDYGSGYNTESTLLYISPQYVKIDMNIIQGISGDSNRRKLVQNLISYAKPRNIKIIAEGVETYADLETLISLDVDYIQGFYVARPNLEVLPIKESIRQEIVECYKKVHN